MSAMDKLAFGAIAVAFFAIGGGMLMYEIARNKSGRPLLKGSHSILFYYATYLSSFVLGTTFTIAVIVR